MNDKVWGFWTTVVWGGVIGLLLALGQVLPIFFYGLVTEPSTMSIAHLRGLMGRVETNALLLAITAIGSTLFVAPLVIFIAKLKRGASLKDYFDFNRVNFKTVKLWLFIAVLLLLVQDFILPIWIDKEMPDFMMNIKYPSDLSKWLLVLGVAFFAPILEELIFRGFLLKSLAHSFLGVYGAIVVTSLVWAIIHFQYEWIYLVLIFLIGLVLGFARFYTNSIYIPMMMHVLFNFSAAIELYVNKGIL